MIGSEVISALPKSSLIDLLELLLRAGVPELPELEVRVRGVRGLRRRRARGRRGPGPGCRRRRSGSGSAPSGRPWRSARRCPGGRGPRSPGSRGPWPAGAGRRVRPPGTRGRRRSRSCSGRAPSRPRAWATASRMALSARLDSPTPVSLASSVLVPTAPSSANATNTNASHPQIAVLRCWALQPPMRQPGPGGPRGLPWRSREIPTSRSPSVATQREANLPRAGEPCRRKPSARARAHRPADARQVRASSKTGAMMLPRRVSWGRPSRWPVSWITVAQSRSQSCVMLAVVGQRQRARVIVQLR